ncbi:MAG: hypothetical protein AAGI52_01005 [Bacteroidota bacterium]
MPLFGSKKLPEVFPEVRATDLDGQDLIFPPDLPAEITLIVVSFRDDLDPLADQWARLGHSIEEQYPERFAVIEAPVVSRGMKLFGDLATAGIRGQVDGAEEHARTLPLYVDKKAFRKSLCVTTEAEVYPFLVHRETGRILWGSSGAIDVAEAQKLEEAVARGLTTPPGPPVSDEEE